MTLINESQNDSKKIRWLLQNDREFFFEFILPHYIKTPQRPVGDFHSKLFHLLDTKRKLGVVAPREHAKSSIITLADNLFDICNGYEPYIVIFSDTPEQAIEHLGNIVEELEGNEMIHTWYGKLYEGRKIGDGTKEKWTQNTIITTNNVKVIARGWRFKARGMRKGAERPSKIVIDDFESDEDVNSEVMREKQRNVFAKKILNLGSQHTKYRMVGTILHYDSLLMNEFTNPRRGWHWEFFKAIGDDGTPLWPEWWSLERLEERKAEIGAIPFQQEFQQNPLDPSQQIIIPKEYYESFDQANCDYYGYIDLAISEKEHADYTAIVTLAKDRTTGKLYILDPIRGHWNVEEQLNKVFEQYAKYRYRSFGVEIVAYQAAFYQVLVSEGQKRGIYIPAVAVELDKDKVRRAIEITPHIDNGTVIFNNGYQDFMSEVIQFPKSAHDDFVDALVGAIKLAMQSSGTATVITGGGMNYSNNS